MSNELIGHSQERVSGMAGIGQSSRDFLGYGIGLVAYSDVQGQVGGGSPIILNVKVHLSLADSPHNGSGKSAIEIKGNVVDDQITKVSEGVGTGCGTRRCFIALDAVNIKAEFEGVWTRSVAEVVDPLEAVLKDDSPSPGPVAQSIYRTRDGDGARSRLAPLGGNVGVK